MDGDLLLWVVGLRWLVFELLGFVVFDGCVYDMKVVIYSFFFFFLMMDL